MDLKLIGDGDCCPSHTKEKDLSLSLSLSLNIYAHTLEYSSFTPATVISSTKIHHMLILCPLWWPLWSLSTVNLLSPVSLVTPWYLPLFSFSNYTTPSPQTTTSWIHSLCDQLYIHNIYIYVCVGNINACAYSYNVVYVSTRIFMYLMCLLGNVWRYIWGVCHFGWRYSFKLYHSHHPKPQPIRSTVCVINFIYAIYICMCRKYRHMCILL